MGKNDIVENTGIHNLLTDEHTYSHHDIKAYNVYTCQDLLQQASGWPGCTQYMPSQKGLTVA